MRLGCEAVASDLNPVAWFILRCTLHYPSMLAGQRRPLPEFALRDRAFVAAFLKGQGVKGQKALRQCLAALGHGEGGSGIGQKAAHEGMQTLLTLGYGDGGTGIRRSVTGGTDQSGAVPSVQTRSALSGRRDASKPSAASASADLLDAPLSVEADFAWHLRAWGQRVLERARRALAARYPTYAEFEPVRRKGRGRQQVQLQRRYRPRPPQLLAPDAEGRVSTAALNAEFDSLYLEDAANPRWVAKPTVAYLWARTVRCAGCRKEVPLLKTRWLCRKGAKRVLLTMTPGEAGVVFGIEEAVPAGGAAPGRLSDQQLGAGTMSGSGATCPCCGVTAAMSDLRAAGRAGQLGERLTAVVVDGQQGKEYRLPTEAEIEAASVSEDALAELYAEIPFGLPNEPTPSEHSLGMRIPKYGFDTWRKLFTNRQLLALGTFVRELRSLWVAPAGTSSRSRVGESGGNSVSPTEAELAKTSNQGGAGGIEPLSESGRSPGVRSNASLPASALSSPQGSQPPSATQRPERPASHLKTGQGAVGTSNAGLSAPISSSPQGPRPPSEAQGRSHSKSSAALIGNMSELDDYPQEWREALSACLALSISRLADRGSSLATWTNDRETTRSTFARFALPIVWDFAESCPLADTSGSFGQAIEWIARVVEHLQGAAQGAPQPQVLRQSAAEALPGAFDLICTDPPYYDAIPYSDLMDFFHIWLRRALHGLSPETDAVFAEPLGPKWNAAANDGELIDDAARFGGDKAASKRNYEDGMARSFARFHEALREDGRLVIVFANKQPDAWETLVSALIRAGFVVVGSWPIQTEMQNRQRSLSSAALSSSIWLVCRKRPAAARPGWDRQVLAEMQANIRQRLRDFWDAGIRGPDFVWAATGPALEAFSRHPVVKFTDAPGERLTVAEFLRQVRRMVVGFVVSRLFEAGGGAMQELDDPTTYYLLHRNDFGLAAAPAGACILYALSCNLSDADLAGRLDLLARGKGAAPAENGDDDEDTDAQASGSEARLKPWNRRRAKDLGEPAADGSPPPLIDCLHRLMRLWKTGEQSRVDAYLESRGLWRHELFARVVQALIELAEAGSDERAILEYIQNHLAAQGAAAAPRQEALLSE